MTKQTKDRIRISLNVNKDIHRLLKRMSYILKKPISRIFDETFEPLVQEFKVDSFDLCRGNFLHSLHTAVDDEEPVITEFGDIFWTIREIETEIAFLEMELNGTLKEIHNKVTNKKMSKNQGKEFAKKATAKNKSEIELIENKINEITDGFSKRWQEAVERENT